MGCSTPGFPVLHYLLKIRAEINEIKTRKTIKKVNETKSWFFQKISKIDKLLARLKDLYRLFFKRSHTDGQQVHEMVLSITNHPGNASQNYSEMSPHTWTYAIEDMDKSEPFFIVGGNINWYSHNGKQYVHSSQSIWKYHMIQQSHSGYISEGNHSLKEISTLPSSLQH